MRTTNRTTTPQKLKQSGWYPLFVFFFSCSLFLTVIKVKPFYDVHVLKGKIVALKEWNRQFRQQVNRLREKNQSLHQHLEKANATQSVNQSHPSESSAMPFTPMLINPPSIVADAEERAKSTDLRNEAAETANLQGGKESLDRDSLRNAILDEVPPNQREAVEAFFNDGEAYRESLTTQAERQSLQAYTEAIMEGAMSEMKTIMANGTEEERKALERTLSDPARLKLVLQMVETSAANAMRTMEEAQRIAEEIIEQDSMEGEFIEEEILTVE